MRYYQGPDGEVLKANSKSGEKVLQQYAELVEDQKEREKLFIEFVRKMGAKAAIRNEGWVDRKNNKFMIPHYAFFINEDLKEGDMVAIGDPEKYMLVKITNVKRPIIGTKKTYSY